MFLPLSGLFVIIYSRFSAKNAVKFSLGISLKPGAMFMGAKALANQNAGTTITACEKIRSTYKKTVTYCMEISLLQSINAYDLYSS